MYSDGGSNSSPVMETPEPMPREEFLEYVKENHTAESNKNEELVAKTIDFAGDNIERKEEIAATIADGFTKKEIKTMTEQGDLLVVHGEKVVDNPNADGSHQYRSADGSCEIRLDDDADKTGITHEIIHHLRVEDTDRKGLSKTAYKLDKDGHVIASSKNESNTFAEEYAVVAEAEIRTKYPTSRPNDLMRRIDRQIIPKRSKQEEESYKLERNTMRTKADGVKSNETVPVFKEADPKDVMPDGNNLRGKKAMDMFDRNFRRSRLGYAPKTANKNAKSNVEVIIENNEEK